MNRILYIQASPRKERSKSIQAADAFVESYLNSHPTDTVEKLNLFEADLPLFDGLAVQAKYTILHGQKHTAEEKKAWESIEKVIEQFKAADKYVFAVPMWNFGIPWRLKQYIDILVQPGYTFRVGPNGYEGLVCRKPAVVIYSSGGTYAPDSPFDLQKRYFELILRFIGFETISSITAAPTLGDPAESEKAIHSALQQARKLAETF
jgi:FMN-dependent NADH-azoreductase